MLALQGAVGRHRAVLERLGVAAPEVKVPADLDEVDALVVPGGESTTISQLLELQGLFDPIAQRLASGMPALGTCAGMILLAENVMDGRGDQRCFAAIDIDVRRNAFGRQIDSFECDLAVAELGEAPVHAVFIRAPIVERAGADVDVLASVGGRAVLCRQGSIIAAAFHPELVDDPRLHEFFLSTVDAAARY